MRIDDSLWAAKVSTAADAYIERRTPLVTVSAAPSCSSLSERMAEQRCTSVGVCRSSMIVQLLGMHLNLVEHWAEQDSDTIRRIARAEEVQGILGLKFLAERSHFGRTV